MIHCMQMGWIIIHNSRFLWSMSFDSQKHLAKWENWQIIGWRVGGGDTKLQTWDPWNPSVQISSDFSNKQQKVYS
jgi:hypothetical protein